MSSVTTAVLPTTALLQSTAMRKQNGLTMCSYRARVKVSAKEEGILQSTDERTHIRVSRGLSHTHCMAVIETRVVLQTTNSSRVRSVRAGHVAAALSIRGCWETPATRLHLAAARHDKHQ